MAALVPPDEMHKPPLFKGYSNIAYNFEAAIRGLGWLKTLLLRKVASSILLHP